MCKFIGNVYYMNVMRSTLKRSWGCEVKEITIDGSENQLKCAFVAVL